MNLQKFEEAVARNISAGTILARYDICFRVEDKVDIRFWEILLAPYTKQKKVKFFPFVQKGKKRITGKSYIMRHISMASSTYVLCVDSDLDYLLQRPNFDVHHYILQTYTYSWENHHCWHINLQSMWEKWQKNKIFDFTIFLTSLGDIIYDALVVLLTKKRLKHNGLTLDSMCNIINKNQANRKDDLKNNGAELLSKIRTSYNALLNKTTSEDERELTITRQHLLKFGVTSDNAYLYMQGHSIYNLVCRIGKALMQDDSFEYQILIPSFSGALDYQELIKIEKDIQQIIG